MYHSQNKPSLKLKIHKIVSDTELMKCPTALEKVNTFNMKIIETSPLIGMLKMIGIFI